MDTRAIGVIEGVCLGPWQIPTRCQISHLYQYAKENSLKIHRIHSEFIGWRTYPNFPFQTTYDAVLFFSIYQLPKSKDHVCYFASRFYKTPLHFALEDIQISPAANIDTYVTLLNELIKQSKEYL